jgi:hypothetical protein
MTGVASASIVMDFTGNYDGNQTTEEPGREISIQGEFNVRGDNAVNPTITVTSSEQTVMNQESFSVFVEGESGLEVDKSLTEEGVVLTAEEIPEGTTIAVEFTVYPRGTDEVNITAAEMEANYETPGGTSQSTSEEFDITLEGGPEQEIQRLEQELAVAESENGESDGRGLLFWIGIAVAGIIGLLILVAAIDTYT